MSKRAWFLLLMLLFLLTASISGTLTYQNSSDSNEGIIAVTYMDIAQNEWERASDGTLIPYRQNKPLFPANYEGNAIPLDEDATNWPGGDPAWQTLEATPGIVDKFITITNEGKETAYVRSIVAVERLGRENSIHINHNEKTEADSPMASVERVQNVPVDSRCFDVYIYTYRDPLASGKTTVPSLKQLYMDKDCTNAEIEMAGSTYDVLALAQAVQSSEFSDAETALNTAFGIATPENLSQWLAKVYSGDGDIPAGDTENSGDPQEPDDLLPPQEQPIVVSSVEELNAALEKVPQGGQVIIRLNPSDTPYTNIQHGKNKTITLMGQEGVTLQMITSATTLDASDPTFEGSRLRLENMTVQAAKAGNHQGFACQSIEMENVILNGSMQLFAPAIFTQSHFINENAKEYCIETNGQNLTLTDCDFVTYGKAVLVEHTGGQDHTVQASSCLFSDSTDGNANKNAVFVTFSDGGTGTCHLLLDDCTIQRGFAFSKKGNDTGSKLWSNDNRMDDAMLNVTIDGQPVH